MNFHPSILREYDIRGIVGQTLSEEDAYWIGRCFGHVVKEQKGTAIAVGRDGRLSSPQLEANLVKGLCESGLDVYRLGIVPTPLLYFSEYSLSVDAAIMVTGSHNPPSHNGFKMSLGRKPFFGQDIFNFSKLIEQKLHEGNGTVYEKNLHESYLNRLFQDVVLKKKLTVAWDPGNGATCDILKSLLLKLPGRHILLNGEIDGTFPAHPPDPSNPKNLVELQQVVTEQKCDLGIAFDGDGDRLTVIDGKGRILWGDQLLLIFAKDLLQHEKNATIIGDVKASQLLFDEVKRLGGNPILWKTGHSHIKAKMMETHAQLAGEMSGHFFFKKDYYGFDDGIYAAIQMLKLLDHSSKSLAQLYDELPYLPSTPEMRISCTSEQKFKIPQLIKTRLNLEGYHLTDIDGIRVQLKEGWWLLRASHTQDVLVARCEASPHESLEYVVNHLKEELRKEGIVLNDPESL